MGNKFTVLSKFKESFFEIKSIRNISLISIFLAFLVVLNLMVFEVSQLISISFEFLAFLLVGAMFGPLIGAFFGFFGDLLCYFIHPVGAFYVWYAVSTMVDGIFYGIFLYKNKFNLKVVILVQILRDILINVFLNTLFIHMQFGGDFLKLLFFVRIPKNLIKIPINCFIVVILIKFLKKVVKNAFEK